MNETLSKTLRQIEIQEFTDIKQFTKSHTLPPQLHFNSNVAKTDHYKAELFNQYFFSVFTRTTSLEPNPNDLSIPASSLDSINLTESDVFNALVNLNPLKATGIDYIAPIILKNCADSLVAPLFHLFTTSVNTSIIPTEWKTHKIIPIYKTGDKTSVKN